MPTQRILLRPCVPLFDRRRKSSSSARCVTSKRPRSLSKRPKRATLCFSTLHTIDASKTIDRIIGLYPKNEERIIRTRLAQTFRYIVSQRLIPEADGKGRIAAVEILRSNPRTREYIEKGESEGKTLLDAIRDGEIDGMQDFDSVIRSFIEAGLIIARRRTVIRDESEQSAAPAQRSFVDRRLCQRRQAEGGEHCWCSDPAAGDNRTRS